MGNKYYTPDIENEIWKDIPGYEEYYEVSNTGLIRRKAYIMKCRLTHDGYCFSVNEFRQIIKLLNIK